MDSDALEIIIWILVALGGVVAKAFQNMSKQKQERERRQTNHPEIPQFEPETEYEYDTAPGEIIFEESTPSEEVTEASPPEFKDVIAETEGSAAFINTNAELLSDDLARLGDSFSDELEAMSSPLSEEEAFRQPTGERKSVLNLRQAIIHSEIIKPKYI